MTEWGVVGVLIAFAGLFLTVGSPILKLNSTMTRLDSSLRFQSKEIAANKADNDESHRELRQALAEHDKAIRQQDKDIDRIKSALFREKG